MQQKTIYAKVSLDFMQTSMEMIHDGENIWKRYIRKIRYFIKEKIVEPHVNFAKNCMDLIFTFKIYKDII